MRPPDKRRGGGPAAAPVAFIELRDEHHTAAKSRLQRLAIHLHGLGPRALYEFLAELAAVHGSDVIDRLENYGKIDADTLRALGGDRFPPMPIRRVA